MSLKILHSQDYHNSLNDVIENELVDIHKNKELWVSMGNELEIEGVQKNQISKIMRKDIEDKLYEKQFYKFLSRKDYHWHTGSYWIVTKQNGWTDNFMARHTLDPVENQEIVLYTNKSMKSICYDIINLCKIMIEKSKSNISFEKTFGKKEMDEFYKQRHTIINNCKNVIDYKTKIPSNTEIFLLECLSTILASTNKCAEKFMEQNLIRFKEQGKFLTLKQTTKFQNGTKQSHQFILKPPTRDMAIFLDYTGIQCTCGSFRVRMKGGNGIDSFKLICYDCNKILPKCHISKCSVCKIPLYKERLLHIVKTNKCENCDSVIDLPTELIEYAKS